MLSVNDQTKPRRAISRAIQNLFESRQVSFLNLYTNTLTLFLRVEVLKPFYQGLFINHLKLLKVLVRALHSGNSTVMSNLSHTKATITETSVTSLISTGHC